MNRFFVIPFVTFGLAAMLAALPFELPRGFAGPCVKTAGAVPGNGNANGHANGHANGQGRGLGLGHGGFEAGLPPGQADGGPPNGRAVGLARANDAVSGVTNGSWEGVNPNATFTGSFHAVNASPNAKPSSNSQVARVRNYLDQVSMEEIDVEAAAQAAALASNHTVTKQMLEAVHAIAGIEVDEQTTGDIATRAAEIQSGVDEVDGEADEEF